MGKKKTLVFRDGSKNQSRVDNDKIAAIRTWDDIEHDSEDEFHEEREKILLDNDGYFNQDDQDSEAEVYGLDVDSEEELSEDDIMGEDAAVEEDDEDETWGRSKKAYYNAEEDEDLEDMREEEKEALRIQREQLAAMDEADYMDDTLSGWGQGTGVDAETDKQLVKEVNKDLDDITFDVTATVTKRRKNLPVSEKLKILQNESPELLDLLNEFKDRSNMLNELGSDMERIGRSDAQHVRFLRFKYQLLSNYLTNISFYFVLKASGNADVRTHPVINALLELRSILERADKVQQKLANQINSFLNTGGAQNAEDMIPTSKTTKKTNAEKIKIKQRRYSDSPLPVELDDVVESGDNDKQGYITDIDIEEEFKALKKSAKKRKRMVADDFGELEVMDELDMEDKIKKKRSIRDYVAKIDAKQHSKLAKYHGDSDLPYRDRRNHSKMGVRQPQDASADLDDRDFDDNDIEVSNSMRRDDNSDDDYYTNVAAEKAALKLNKKEEYEAGRTPIIDDNVPVGDNEKRLASWQILKNKGLTPHRKKENRNARVKHKNRYAKKLKKLSSVRAVVKPLQGTYGGEATGIKSNVIKSVRF